MGVTIPIPPTILNSMALATKKPARKPASARPKARPSTPASWGALRLALSGLGLKPKYLKEAVLPSWWEPSVVADRNGFLETVALIHRRTGLDLPSLMAGVPLWKGGGSVVKFKKSPRKSEDDVKTCQMLARQAAEVVASAMTIPVQNRFPEVRELHAILKDHGAHPWVGLDDLTAWCWRSGIPVIHVNNFPDGCRKPDGLVVRTSSGRPVIVLCRASVWPAWQVFIIAHELGHIALGHVPEGGVLIDAGLEQSTDETEEAEANRYAVELLTGQPDLGLTSSGHMNASALATSARAFGERNRINSGVAALNWGFTTGQWEVANGAVKILEGKQDALKVIREAGAAGLDWGEVSSDVAEWLERMTGLRPAV